MSIPFRGKTLVGIVWHHPTQPEIDIKKIRSIIEVFENEPKLPENWRLLCSFAARYYHYPIGQTVFTALVPALRENKPITIPTPPRLVKLNQLGQQQPAPPARAKRQQALWHQLQTTWQDEAVLKKSYPNTYAIIAQWHQQGWIDYCTDSTNLHIPPSRHTLNAQQTEAVQQICASFHSFQPFLLHGITGSGKTEVYFECIAKILAAGKQVLFLLPEIGLTPQLLNRIQERFGTISTAVLHSQTATGSRNHDYLRAMQGQVQLIIGTRLAVFTPLPNLGLIIVDEEHDSSFKQDSELRYHARDLAIWRAKQTLCPIVLGSATPSLESWHKSQNGSYQLLQLTERAHQHATLPVISLFDVRRIPLHHGFAPTVLEQIQSHFQQGGMSLIYLNRRGFAPALFCSSCGHTFGCPDCSAKMVLHQRSRQLRCHHCNRSTSIPFACPECGNQDLSAVGYGTQRIEETLRVALPTARILRADRDSVSNKNDWKQLYDSIQQHQVDILVGTQMLAKGHDFSRLNLVVVMNADGSLYSSDFRASERLFSELMQVSGRSGRAKQAGRVIIQTQFPEHPVFQYLLSHDYVAFAHYELQERQLFSLPPFQFQAAIRADALTADEALNHLNDIKQQLTSQIPESVQQLGPAPMFMVRLAGRERVQLFLESANRQALHHAISLWQHALSFHAKHSIRWHIDVDTQEI